MNGVDTNVFVYRFDTHEPVKRAKAQALLKQLHASATPTVLLWQVAGELLRQLRAWEDQGRLGRSLVKRYFAVVRRLFPLVLPAEAVLDHALDLAGRYSLSHWDSMLLGACIESKVTTLYTEDMGSPRTIDSIQLVNPF